jgi:Uncharacterized protein conserved in bacteria
MVRLNLGCGEIRPENWINTDSSLNSFVQRFPILGRVIPVILKSRKYESNRVKYMNLNRKWHFKDDSVDVVYASHVFEHLTLHSADLFLKESYRCLKPGGIIRIVVPDLYKICKKYIHEYEHTNSEDPTTYILWAINMHREGQYGKTNNWLKKIVHVLQDYPHQHKYMYDTKSLTKRFSETGFYEIQSFEYGISNIIQITDVEGTREHYLSVYLEAKKPL